MTDFDTKYLRSGFTLIEMLMVIAIMLTLAGILLPVLLKTKSKGKIRQGYTEMGSIKSAVMSYHMDTRNWPNAALKQNVDSTYDVDNQQVIGPLTSNVPPYLDASDLKSDGSGNLVDPWNTCYKIYIDYDNDGIYNNNGNQLLPDGVAVRSAGPDATFGNSDDLETDRNGP